MRQCVFSTPPAMPQGSAADRADSAASSGRPGHCAASFSPEHKFPVPQPTISTFRPDCCTTSMAFHLTAYIPTATTAVALLRLSAHGRKLTLRFR
jgi:hypothetical protein